MSVQAVRSTKKFSKGGYKHSNSIENLKAVILVSSGFIQ